MYSKEQQASDRSFLVGANYGRETERSRIIKWLTDNGHKELAKELENE